MKKFISTLCLFLLLFVAAMAQDVTLPGPAGCNGAAVTGTWIVPCDVTNVTVQVYGGGGGAGGGGGGSNGGLFNTRGGGGAGGGGFTTITINVVPGSSFTYSIGAGGCGGGNGSDGNDGNNGTSGASTTFNGTAQGGTPVNLTANGGTRGTGGDGTGGSTGNGGAGGTASGGSTNTTGTAGNGGSGGNGGNGGGAGGPSGGAGGASTGAPGGSYGGGGAGGGNSSGGPGAAGGILITYNTTIALPITPTISSTPPTCTVDGSSTISNYNAASTYTFTPAGPTVGAGGAISGMVTGTSYTVVDGTGSCASAPSNAFSNTASTGPPTVPLIATVQPTCSSDGTGAINNYNAAMTYVFTPSGPTVLAGGAMSGLVVGTSYSVVADDGSCSSGSSVSFSIGAQLASPPVPNVSSTPPTCVADGSSAISNYNAAFTYAFTPAGPSAGAGGAISGMVTGTGYTITANNGTCTSAASASFSNAPLTAPPAVPTVSTAAPTCAAEGSSTITNYNAAVTYIFTPSGPSAGAGGAISGMTAGTSYTVEASDGSCNSAPSTSFSNSAQLTVPVAAVSGQLSYCTGSNTTLTASGGAIYIWGDAGGNIIGNTASVTVTQGTYTVLVSNANGCADTTTVTVAELSTLPVTISGTLSYCPGSNTTITANGGTGYVWNDAGNSTTASITVTAGSYSVTGTDANGCTGTATATVTQSPAPAINISGALSYCAGANTTLTASGGTGYVWNDAGNSTTASITVTQGSYTVTGTDATGCTATASATVTENASPAVSITGLLTYCTGGNTTLTASGGNTYVWSNGATTVSVTVTQATYSVTATDGNTCTGTASAAVTESATLSVNITGALSYCPGANTTLTATGGTGYIWSNGSTAANITVTLGSYAVTATDAACSGTSSAVVSEIATTPVNLGNNVTACDDSLVTIDAGTGYTGYTWASGETTQTIVPQTSGTYSVTVVDANSCTVSGSLNVVFNSCNEVEYNIYIPTAFSPNGDGANDVFRAVVPLGVKKFTLRIFNRWGELVFETTDVREGWDGVYQRIPQPLGSYVWYADYTFNDDSKHTKAGNVTLVR